MATTAEPTPVLDGLSEYYAHHWAGAGEARWLRHAWQTLATVDHVPHEIPDDGEGAVDARIRLAVLARFSDQFHNADVDDELEPPDITSGPHAVEAKSVLDWMSAYGIKAEYRFEAELADEDEEPEPPRLDQSDIESCADAITREVISALLAVRTTNELFAELVVQRYETTGQLVGDYPEDGDESAPLVYPLNDDQVDAVFRDISDEKHAAYEWLDQYVAGVRRA